MNPFKFFYNFILDKTIKLSHRAAIIILLVFSVFIIDNIMGFSFNYRVRAKLENLKRADELIVNSNTDSITKQYAIAMRNTIGDRKNIIEYLFSRKKPSNKSHTPIITKKESSIKNDVYFVLSTSGLFIMAAFFSVWINLFLKKKEGTFLQRLAMSLLFVVIFLSGGLILNVLLKKLPYIPEGGNFAVNFFIQLIFLFLIIYVSSGEYAKDLKEKVIRNDLLRWSKANEKKG